MKAVTWHGRHDVRVERVPDPTILNPHDAIVAVTSTAICGSDLHLYSGAAPSMRAGDILGHEVIGEVVEVGPAVARLRRGARVVVPAVIACGHCEPCASELHALCDNSNPNAWMMQELYGGAGAGVYGQSHLYGGYAGGQAEYVRVPFADVGALEVPGDLPDDKVLFLSDVFPTGWQAAAQCRLQPGQVVAVWGCGAVGQLAIRSALMLGADRVIAIDREPERLDLAARAGAVDVIDFGRVPVLDTLRELTAGRGPDACIDAVGLEAHGVGLIGAYDRVKHAVRLETDRPYVLREAIQACRKGGVVSVPGMYGGFVDKLNVGAVFTKGLTLVAGPTHVHRWMKPLLARIVAGDIDPSFVITHRLRLDDAPEAYRRFLEKRDGCVKVVLKP